jgi:hypothetical protein
VNDERVLDIIKERIADMRANYVLVGFVPVHIDDLERWLWGPPCNELPTPPGLPYWITK